MESNETHTHTDNKKVAALIFARDFKVETMDLKWQLSFRMLAFAIFHLLALLRLALFIHSFCLIGSVGWFGNAFVFQKLIHFENGNSINEKCNQIALNSQNRQAHRYRDAETIVRWGKETRKTLNVFAHTFAIRWADPIHLIHIHGAWAAAVNVFPFLHQCNNNSNNSTFCSFVSFIFMKFVCKYLCIVAVVGIHIHFIRRRRRWRIRFLFGDFLFILFCSFSASLLYDHGTNFFRRTTIQLLLSALSLILIFL